MDIKKVFVVATLLLITGCTSYLYQSKIVAADSNDVDREVLLYWFKTKPLIGQAKGGPASLITQCGNRIGFDERPEGIIFRGTIGSDYLVGSEASIQDGEQCGRFLSFSSFVDEVPNQVQVVIMCGPLSDEFSVTPRSYIKASTMPYVCDISVTEKWSMLGELPAAPTLANCAD